MEENIYAMKVNFQLFMLFSEFAAEHLLIYIHFPIIIILNTHFCDSLLSMYLSFLELI